MRQTGTTRGDCRGGRAGGFGLIELIVTITIIAVLAAIALPNFRTLISGNRTTTQANDLVAALNLARNEAITRNRPVTVCAAATASGTPSACAAATAWNQGWMVFLDNKTDTAAPDSVAASSVLRSGLADANVAVSSAAAFIRFSSRGEVLASAERTFVLKPASNCQGGQARQITVGLIGRIGTKRLDTCS